MDTANRATSSQAQHYLLPEQRIKRGGRFFRTCLTSLCTGLRSTASEGRSKRINMQPLPGERVRSVNKSSYGRHREVYDRSYQASVQSVEGGSAADNPLLAAKPVLLLPSLRAQPSTPPPHEHDPTGESVALPVQLSR